MDWEASVSKELNKQKKQPGIKSIVILSESYLNIQYRMMNVEVRHSVVWYIKRQSEAIPNFEISASGGFDIRYSVSAYWWHQ